MAQMTLTQPSSLNWKNPMAFIRSAWVENKPLTILSIGSFILMLSTLTLMGISDATVLGEPAWLKPTKFTVSITIYGITLLWLLSYINGKKRSIQVLSWGTLVGFIVEYVAIFWQASRGVRSHFNVATPFDALMFNLMGSFVMIIWLCGLVACILLIRQKMEPRTFGLSLKLGIAVSLVGGGLGALMTSGPTPAQAASWEAGAPVTEVGAHNVGVEDGGAGLPIVGWSTEGGDLRIPHFIGLHALQVIPLLGFAIIRSRYNNRQKNGLVWVVGLGYLGLTILLTWQALRGQSIIAPDALTLMAGTGLVGLMGVATAVITRKNS